MCELVYQDVLDALVRIRPRLPATPFHEIPSFSEKFGCRFFLKFESMQPIGAFKVRGGVNLVSQLPELDRRRGLITASTGNHGASIAWAARVFGVRATIIAPESSNPDKLAAIQRMGAEVVLHGKDFDEAREWCEDQAEENNVRYVHSANEPALIAGVGTVALECFEQEPGIDVLIVPIGGGSGAAGTALVAKDRTPQVRVVGVQAERAPAVYQSFQAGKLIPHPSANTFADGLATRVPFELTLSMMQRTVDEVVLVSEEEMCEAIRLLVSEVRVIAEGAGAASTAAAMKMDLKGKTVAAVLSGRNLTAANLQTILLGGVPQP